LDLRTEKEVKVRENGGEVDRLRDERVCEKGSEALRVCEKFRVKIIIKK